MPDRERFPYLPTDSPISAPWLPLRLRQNQVEIPAVGLVDSGAAVSVLPFDLGISLGLNWDRQTIPLRLTGNLADSPAWAVTLRAEVASFPAQVLTFAWTRSETVPLILGQVNFFKAFDVCFFGSQRCFEVALANRSGI